MPELPEVETLRLQLSSLIIGKTVKSLEVFRPKSFTGNKKDIIGKKITGIRRVAKMLLLDLSSGLSLVIHLKMTGQLIFNGKKNKHTRLTISFTDGAFLVFNDQRTFGWIRLVKEPEKLTEKIGPDPLRDLSADKFKEILNASKRPVKLVLMDQEKIGGVGNIYANDALFLAGIDPRTKTNKLSNSQMVKLLTCLKKILKNGIRLGGASKTNFVDAFGQKGKAQEHFYVYDKEGKKCINNCGGKIRRIVLGGRGTFFCPKCQR